VKKFIFGSLLVCFLPPAWGRIATFILGWRRFATSANPCPLREDGENDNHAQ